MKKSFALILALIVAISTVFVACSSKESDTKETTATTAEGLQGAETEYGIETDADGNEVNVVYEKDKDGKTVAYVIDENGDKKKDKNGKEVTLKATTTTTKKTNNNNETSSNKSNDSSNSSSNSGSDTTKATTEAQTATTNKADETTEKELTTLPSDKDNVPLTSATGTVVSFSEKDQTTIAKMLSVPGITAYSYENKSGVDAQLATHVAVWMAQRENLSDTTYPSGTVVLDLFKFFGQTVVNFKSDCTDASKKSGAPITYSAKNDTFNISSAEKQEQTIKIKQIEKLGNNNYYRVTAEVSGVKDVNSVVAVVQKNRLDSSLGFSIKALKWSK